MTEMYVKISFYDTPLKLGIFCLFCFFKIFYSIQTEKKLFSLFPGLPAVQIKKHSGIVANPCCCACKVSLKQQ